MVWLAQMPVNAVKSATIPITVFGKTSASMMKKMRLKKMTLPTKMIDDREGDR